MISRRAPRASGAVERLKQFSLTNNAGVSCVAAPNDTKTVYMSKNLSTNLDGSVSLRKPIVLQNRFSKNISKVIPTGVDGVHLALGTFHGSEGAVLLSKDLTQLPFQIIWRDVLGNERICDAKNHVLLKDELDLTNCHHTHTSSTLFLSNCIVPISLKEFTGDVVVPSKGMWGWDVSVNSGVETPESIYVDDSNVLHYGLSYGYIVKENTTESLYPLGRTFVLSKLNSGLTYEILGPRTNTSGTVVTGTVATLSVSFVATRVAPVFDTSLYKSQLDSASGTSSQSVQYVPRCVSVYKSETTDSWCVKIVSPLKNTYTSSDYGTGHPTDLLCDNPFAVSDNYESTLPYVHIIREYVPTMLQFGSPLHITPALNEGTTSEVRQYKTPYSAKISTSRTPECTVLYELKNPDDAAVGNRNSNGIVIGDHQFSISCEVEQYELSSKLALGPGISITSKFQGMMSVMLRFTADEDSTEYSLSKTDAVFIGANYISEYSLFKDDVLEDLKDFESFRVKLSPANQEFYWMLDMALDDETVFKLVDYTATENYGSEKTYTLDALKEAALTESELYNTSQKHQAYHVVSGIKLKPGDTYKAELVDKLFRASGIGDLYRISARIGVRPATGFTYHPDGTVFTTKEFPLRADYIGTKTVTNLFAEISEYVTNLTVAQCTESVADVRFRAAVPDASGVSFKILKAFVDVPINDSGTYCSWRYSNDGITWIDALEPSTGSVKVSEPTYRPVVSLPNFENETIGDVAIGEVKQAYNCAKLLARNASTDTVSSRADCLLVDARLNPSLANAAAYMFKLYQGVGGKLLECGTAVLYRDGTSDTEYEQFDLGNASLGIPMFKSSRLFLYGHPSFKTNVFYTYPNELSIPVKNTIDVTTLPSSRVTKLLVWKDLLVFATPDAIFRADQSSDGFYTKGINTAVGIPEKDANCCVTALNMVVFKSENKIYAIYPNVYSGSDDVLNVTEISNSVAHYLEEAEREESNYRPFAFNTSSEYVLMLPYPEGTRCLRYNYNTRLWNVHTYPVVFESVFMRNVADVRLYGRVVGFDAVCEFKFDTVYGDDYVYGDVLATSVHNNPVSDLLLNLKGVYGITSKDVDAAIGEYQSNEIPDSLIKPISFELDTGQKSDTISTTKQFVETKIVVATAHVDDTFPMSLTIHIDGDPHIVTRDLSTDAAFAKQTNTGGVLGTTFGQLSSESDPVNTIRQIVVRYSGKGKSIRHILTGKSCRNFKIYETYIRYKDLNVKQ